MGIRASLGRGDIRAPLGNFVPPPLGDFNQNTAHYIHIPPPPPEMSSEVLLPPPLGNFPKCIPVNRYFVPPFWKLPNIALRPTVHAACCTVLSTNLASDCGFQCRLPLSPPSSASCARAAPASSAAQCTPAAA